MERAMATSYVLWLIEHPDNGTKSPSYFGWEEGEKGWTGDIKAAFKFETKDAAEMMASDCGLPDWRVADHRWLDHKPTSNWT
jgi:hypothetical protein